MEYPEWGFDGCRLKGKGKKKRQRTWAVVVDLDVFSKHKIFDLIKSFHNEMDMYLPQWLLVIWCCLPSSTLHLLSSFNPLSPPHSSLHTLPPHTFPLHGFSSSLLPVALLSNSQLKDTDPPLSLTPENSCGLKGKKGGWNIFLWFFFFVLFYRSKA